MTFLPWAPATQTASLRPAQFLPHTVTPPHTDVIVVGAGPAGSATALRLVRRGLRVVLLERRRFLEPHNDRLRSGEGLIPATQRALAALDLPADPSTWELDTISHIQMHWPNGTVATCPVGERGGVVQVDREQLDYALYDAALQAGVVGLQGWRARALQRDQRGQVVGVWAQAIDRKPVLLRAALVVDAGGRSAGSMRELPIRTDDNNGQFMAICMFFDQVHDLIPGHWEMHMLDEQHLAVVQLSQLRGGVVRCALGAPWGMLGTPACHPRELFQRCIARNTGLAERLAASTVIGTPYIRAKIGYAVRDVVFDGLLLVGDATGYVNPLFGDGILRALRSAERAASAISGALEHGDTSRAGLAGYARSHAVAYQRDRLLHWGLNVAARSPRALGSVAGLPSLQRAGLAALIH